MLVMEVVRFLIYPWHGIHSKTSYSGYEVALNKYEGAPGCTDILHLDHRPIT